MTFITLVTISAAILLALHLHMTVLYLYLVASYRRMENMGTRERKIDLI